MYGNLTFYNKSRQINRRINILWVWLYFSQHNGYSVVVPSLVSEDVWMDQRLLGSFRLVRGWYSLFPDWLSEFLRSWTLARLRTLSVTWRLSGSLSLLLTKDWMSIVCCSSREPESVPGSVGVLGLSSVFPVQRCLSSSRWEQRTS